LNLKSSPAAHPGSNHVCSTPMCTQAQHEVHHLSTASDKSARGCCSSYAQLGVNSNAPKPRK
jgi:hypothetical protein